MTPALRLDAQKAAGVMPDKFLFMDRYRVGAAYLASLDRMLAGAARQGVPVLIVDLPVPADLDDRMYPTEFAAYRAALAEAAGPRRPRPSCHPGRGRPDRRRFQRSGPSQRRRRREDERLVANGHDRRRGGRPA